LLAETIGSLRSLISDALSNQTDAAILLPSAGTFALDGAELVCNAPIRLGIRSEGVATLDGGGLSRIFNITNGCSLALEGIAIINGYSALQVRHSDQSLAAV